MAYVQEGPSEPKKQRKWKDNCHSTLQDLENVLMNSDDDIVYPDFAEDTDEDGESDDSGSEDKFDTSEVANEGTLQSAVAHPDVLNWSSVQDFRQIPFTKQRELLKRPNGNTPEDYFNLLVDDELLNIFVTETNRYAAEVFLQENTSEHSRITRWYDVSVEEMRKFIGIVLHMGTIHLNRLQDYWKTHYLFNITSISSQMSRDRFMIILRCLHFQKRGDQKPTDRLFKVRPLIDYFNKKMIEIYYPDQKLSLDESMVLWKGRLLSRQYIKNKRHKYGLKLYLLSESDGTIIKFAVCTGVLDDYGGRGDTTNIVLHLMEEKLDVGHSVFLNIYYNSYDLATILLSRATYCTGVLRLDRIENPVDVKNAKLNKGESIARHSGGIMVGKWRDKREVSYISSEYDNEIVTFRNRRNEKKKNPECFFFYNQYMGGIGKKDQMMAYYPCERKTIRWYKKLGIHIIQMLLMNSYFLYGKYEKPRIPLYNFRLAVIGSLLPPTSTTSMLRSKVPVEHTIAKNSATATKKHGHRRCNFCFKKIKRARKQFFTVRRAKENQPYAVNRASDYTMKKFSVDVFSC